MKFFEDGDRVQLYKGDCLEIMPQLEGTFDAIICDLPYGTTACSWDVVIPFEPLWECYKRLIKPNGAIVLFGSQPFTSALVMSNPKWFRYEWIWEKSQATGHLDANRRPMKNHENILVFSRQAAFYQPQIEEKKTENIRSGTRGGNKGCYGVFSSTSPRLISSDLAYPKSTLKFNNVNSKPRVHNCEKPIDLLSYLIKTYTLPGERILDNTAGSFSTGVAAVLNGRKFVGIEREEKYCAIGQQRIEKALQEVYSMLIKPWELDEKLPETNQQIELFEAG